MLNGLDLAGVRSLGCMAHTLQLSVKKAIEGQRAVIDALACGRKVDTHFSHSTLAKEKLEEIQLTIPNQPDNHIIQDIHTRWNSTYYMMERLMEQKKPLLLYAADTGLALPNANQWTLMERTKALLAPMEKATKSVSDDESTAVFEHEQESTNR